MITDDCYTRKWRAAIYIRLSKEDYEKGNSESSSVTNQREILKEYIRQHLYEPFNLEQVASYLHISKYHFIRKFKQKVGVTPNQYYIQAKIYAAKQALKQNEKETDVAANLNFSDQSYLCNVFKKQMGISMKDFKQNFVQL